MASVKPIGFEDDLFPDFFEVDCPICGKELKVLFERQDNFVICPSCKNQIEIESE